jgi:hypothetical protein
MTTKALPIGEFPKGVRTRTNWSGKRAGRGRLLSHSRRQPREAHWIGLKPSRFGWGEVHGYMGLASPLTDKSVLPQLDRVIGGGMAMWEPTGVSDLSSIGGGRSGLLGHELRVAPVLVEKEAYEEALRTFRKKVRGPLVARALGQGPADFRTIPSLARETGLPEQDIRAALDLPSVARRPWGRPALDLFAPASRPVSIREVASLLRVFVTKRP